MVTNLREAKSSLSEYVKRASEGEEILITVRGEPKARLVAITPEPKKQMSREEWIAQLTKAAEEGCVGTPKNTPQKVWDEMRADCF